MADINIVVRDKSMAVEQLLTVSDDHPFSVLLPQIAAQIGVTAGDGEHLLPVLERNEQALQLWETLADQGVRDGDAIRLDRGSGGGSVHQDRVREFEESLRIVTHSTKGAISCRRDEAGTYILTVRGLMGLRKRDGKVQVTKEHTIEITLGANYPFDKPGVNMGADFFHPNTYKSGALCYSYTPRMTGTELLYALLQFVTARVFLIEKRSANAEATEWYQAHSAEVARVATAPWPFRVPVLESALTLVRPAR